MRIAIGLGIGLLLLGGIIAEGRNDHVRWSGPDDQRLCVGGGTNCGAKLIVQRTSYGTGGAEPIAP